jgi:hypothetical protein
MVNYANGKIYKIVGSGMTYYGSTCEPTLARRLAGHVGKYKSYKAGKHNYVTSYDIIELGDYEIILLELYSCVSKDELHARERYYIENNECINKIIPGRIHEEHRDLHNASCLKYYYTHKDRVHDYRELNKLIIRDKNNTKHNCDCGGKYTQANKKRHMHSMKHQAYLALNI